MPSESRNLLPLAVVVAGILVAAAIYFGAGSSSNSTYSGGNQAAPAVTVAPASASDHILGSQNAKVVIIEYSDLECPFCKTFHATMHQVVSDYRGQVAWIFRHYPIAELHSRAPKEAEASECAAEQGGNTAFWNYIDKVFAATNSNDSLDPAALPAIAQSLNLDMNTFNQCLTSGKYASVIQKDIADAVKAGARGTPYSVIESGGKNVVVAGAQPYEVVKQTIDTLLKQ